MVGYSFNYSFLNEWMQENNKDKSDILRALGTKNYLSLNHWIDGSVPLPVENMLRLCDTFKIPLEKFFFFNGIDAAVTPIAATESDRIEPTGGWKDNVSGGGSNQRRSSQTLPYIPGTEEGAGTPWTGRASEQIVKQQEEINRLQREVDKLNVELQHKDDSIEERDHRIDDLCVQTRTNEKLVLSLTEQIDFMREQVRIAQNRYPANVSGYDGIAAEVDPCKSKDNRGR